ncbi:MAG: 16S rRNA (guanine(966)-N(2))-methyltransferase RsmD [Alphaproteobacteria bacterium]
MMKCRILSGRLKGRVIPYPEMDGLRPTTDRNREMVFNVLAHRCLRAGTQSFLKDVRVLDCFAGTGSLGLEALSRGASPVFFLENNPELCRRIKTLSMDWKEEAHVTVYNALAIQIPPTNIPAGIIFLDPPYYQNLASQTLDVLTKQGWISPQTWMIFEIEKESDFSAPEKASTHFQKISGKSKFHFFQLEA